MRMFGRIGGCLIVPLAVVALGSAMALGAEPPAKGPRGEETRGDVKISIPVGWQALPKVAPDEGGWFCGSHSAPEASLAIIRLKNFDELVSPVSITSQSDVKLHGRSARLLVGTMDDGKRIVWLVLFEKARGDGRMLAIVAVGPAATWARHAPAMQQAINSLRFTQAP